MVAAGAAVTVMVAVWVTVTLPFTVAVTTLLPVAVELRVPVTWPLVLVAPAGWVSAFPVPVAASATLAPLIGLPNWPFTVTVIVDVFAPALAAMLVGVALTSDLLALTPS